MNILICNERFLFRFGADRVLTLLGKSLEELGYNVYIMANKYDKRVVKTFATKIIEVPTDTDDYLNLNEHTAEWLERRWDEYFNNDNIPDIILVGGWPFFSSIPFFKKVSREVIFIDFGAVPLDGYSGGVLVIQEKLRSLRKQYLKEASLIIGISDFIVNSQSRVDTNGKVPVRTVLLGADHMEMTIWAAKHLHIEKSYGNTINLLKHLKQEGRKIILCLGRWEPNCYKNSDAAFDIMHQITRVFPDCALLILADPSGVNIPPDLQKSIFPIRFPDDKELIHIMKQVDLGISVSLWEGFNLMIAEMQWLDRPVLAFDIGAHPEVILHPWYLCRDNNEMVAKACKILSGFGLDPDTRKQSLEKFHDYFSWKRAINEYNDIFEKSNNDNSDYKKNIKRSIFLIIDVTNATKDPANSGVIRVTRRLSREFQRYLDPVFVVWDQEANCYVLPTRQEFQQLGQFNGPLLTDESRLSPNNCRIPLDDYFSLIDNDSIWLLFTETVNEAHARIVRPYARDNGINLAAIFYDAIPILYPDLVKDIATKNYHGPYMIGLAECDIIVPISKFSSDCLEKFWKDKDIKGCQLSPNLLPGEFGGSTRNDKISEPQKNGINILCVSTLEPRKNHKKLVDACFLMQEKHPEINWNLTLVGNRYAGAFDIADFIQDVSAKYPRIKWLGIVDDATLHRLYEEATFTVFPSIIEGFGIPILESIWHGRPCICSQEGVMAELAAEGGCLTTNVLDEQILSESIYRLATDKELYVKLSQQAITRKIKTWDEYTREFISILKSQNKIINTSRTQRKNSAITDKRNWQEILYPGCLCEHWQMNHSERLAMTALLSRHKPKCSIEIGTYPGGSLSLISQYSEMVFSIDIDPSIPEKFRYFENVCFLTGPSSVILPLLLKELDRGDIPVDFILIDGDHSAEGIKRDIDCLLSYVPKKPLFVMMHDSYNPECRRGMLGIDWEQSPYVGWVDLDFIPGRIIEHNGPTKGEMWGGLALAYFRPTVRQGPLSLNLSVNMMHNICREYCYK